MIPEKFHSFCEIRKIHYKGKRKDIGIHLEDELAYCIQSDHIPEGSFCSSGSE